MESKIPDAMQTLAHYFVFSYMSSTIQTSKLQNAFRVILGFMMCLAAIGHFSFERIAFQAQVPNWVPMDKDLVVILSGVVELAFGLSLIFWKRKKISVGILLAVFFVLVFPGNVAQYVNHASAFGLSTDKSRLIRLFFQPVLIAWALWSTGALSYLFNNPSRRFEQTV